jgi:hypothetical protein
MPEADKTLLPPVPVRDYEKVYDGWEWMDAIAAARNGWYVVSQWGAEGWNLGAWPLVIFAHYDNLHGKGVWGKCVYVEGDLEITAYNSEADRDRATSENAVWYWVHHEEKDAPQTIKDPAAAPYYGWSTPDGRERYRP